MKRYIDKIVLMLMLFAASACIENDIPYPVVELEIVSVEGEGFKLGAGAIDRFQRSVLLTLEEQTDIRKVKITNVELNNSEAKSSVELTGLFDLRTPIYTTLSLYQDYDWVIKAEQSIERRFRVEGQVGDTEWDVENHVAKAYVPKGNFDFSSVNVTELKLGPEGITTMSVEKEELTSFESVRYVDITYHGDIKERWYLYVEPTDVSVLITAVDAWSEVIWLYGAGQSGQKLGFRYRVEGEDEWLEVPDVEVDGGTFKARLKASAETTYEIKAYCGDEESAVQSARTEHTMQLPNCGLEQWCTISDIVYPYADQSQAWWGSGNVGASVANATLTDKNSDVRPGSSGQYSARLESMFANMVGLGKFAAGNLYTGTYVMNVGTNGIITFGRPFELRPTALRLWLKYNCGAVDKINGLPLGSNMKLGDPDFGVVYIAVGDWDKEEYGYGYSQKRDEFVLYGTDDSPICIDTRLESTFFDPTSEAVIGYGDLMMDYSVEEWTQVTIPLKYTATDRKPTHIVVVCSASRYGDYFTGSTNSLMYVDDIELLYD